MLRRIQAACAFQLAICVIGMMSVFDTVVSLPASADETQGTKPALSKEFLDQEFVDVTDLTLSNGQFAFCSFAPKPGRFRMKVTKGWTLKLPLGTEEGSVEWMLMNSQKVGAQAGSKTPKNEEWIQYFPARDPVLEVSGGETAAMALVALRKGTATLRYIGGSGSDDPATFKNCELQIVVESDTSELDQAIKLAVPDAQVRVIEIRNSAAILSGTATTEDDARVILQIGQQFYNEVIPRLKVAPATADSKVPDDSRTHKRKSNKNKRSGKPDVSEMKQLRNDVQSLRDEVRRLSELMEQPKALSRTVPVPFHETQPPELPHHDDPATDYEKNGGITQSPKVDDSPNDQEQTTDLKNSNQVLFFTATWCGPCQKMVPLIDKLKKQGFPIRVVDVDRDSKMTHKMTHQYNVETIPCLIITAKGEEVKRITGLQTEEVLKKLLQDVATVRSEK